MRDLDLLFKEKREESTTVSIELVQSWINGGALLAGLLATLKKLFTKKSWLMYTSISSIAIVTLLTIFQLSAPKPEALSINKQTKIPVNTSAKTLTNQHVQPTNLDLKNSDEPSNGQVELLTKMTQAIPILNTPSADLKLIEPKPNAAPQTLVNNDTTKYFDRIDVNGIVHFTLVKGANCSVNNMVAVKDGGEVFKYSVKQGTLFLEGIAEGAASELIITVPDLKRIKTNGICEIYTQTTFNATDLELKLNGETQLNLDLNVKDLEININGKNSGTLNIQSQTLDLTVNGINDVEVFCIVDRSWLDINGLGKLEFRGSSHYTMMEINGQNKFNGEAFTSDELILKVTGINQKIETTVSKELDVDISGSNNVIIHGSPIEVKQNVAPTSKLKMK
jgi:hypothetical protein